MTDYQRKRVQVAKEFIKEYKMTHPCVDCQNLMEIPERMCLCMTPSSEYRRPLTQLAAGGAALSRMQRACDEREAVCVYCNQKRQRERGTKLWPQKGPSMNAAKAAANLYNQPGAVETYANFGMIIHPDGTVTDSATGQILSHDERAARVTAPVKPGAVVIATASDSRSPEVEKALEWLFD